MFTGEKTILYRKSLSAYRSQKFILIPFFEGKDVMPDIKIELDKAMEFADSLEMEFIKVLQEKR